MTKQTDPEPQALGDPPEPKRGPQVHIVKSIHRFFIDVKAGRKNFEIRFNDRGYRVGDMLVLNEIVDGESEPRGVLVRKIIYMTDFEQKPGYVVLGLEDWTNP